MSPNSAPDLYWISGSPPSWRVMLALTLKRVTFRSCRLDADRNENRTPAYLRINPTGQVPTLVHGRVTVRESIAILAYMDRAWSECPIFGSTPSEAAEIWQAVMVFESRLAPAAGTVARALFRGTSHENREGFSNAVDQLLAGLDEIDASLSGADFLTGPAPTAADIWLFPTLAWIARALETPADPVPDAMSGWLHQCPNLTEWRGRFAEWPGVAKTAPPHWQDTQTTTP